MAQPAEAYPLGYYASELGKRTRWIYSQCIFKVCLPQYEVTYLNHGITAHQLITRSYLACNDSESGKGGWVATLQVIKVIRRHVRATSLEASPLHITASI